MRIAYNDSGEVTDGGLSIFSKPDRTQYDRVCYENFIPRRLRSNPLFERVNKLLCLFPSERFSDAEIRLYLDKSDDLVRSALHSSYIDLNWYSLLSWEDVTEYNWSDNYVNAGVSNFKSRDTAPRIPNIDVWKGISGVNEEKFNENGFTAWNIFLEPYVGTNLIQRKLLQSLRLDGKIVDWYDDNTPINTYSFIFDEFPGWERTKTLILASNILKNAESHLTTIKDENCPRSLRLSHGFLDSDFVSDIHGNKFYGAYICFQRFYPKLSDYFTEFSSIYLRSKFQSRRINYWEEIFLSEGLLLSERNFNKIFRTHISLTPGKFVQLLPAYMKDIKNDWGSATTWEDHYTWDGINITNLIYTKLEHTPMTWEYLNPNTGTIQTWESTATWEGDIDESSYTYNRPCTGNDCIVNRNFIPGFEPGNAVSLYSTLVIQQNISTFDPNADILIARGGIVQYWDPNFILGYMELDGVSENYVLKEHTRIAV